VIIINQLVTFFVIASYLLSVLIVQVGLITGMKPFVQEQSALVKKG